MVYDMTKGYEQRKEANKKYLATLDEIRIRMPKGERDKLKAFVEEYGFVSMNQFVVDAMEYYKEVVIRERNDSK